MTYNFDPERWYDMQRNALADRRDRGELTADEYREQLAELDRRLAELVDRLDGSYRIPRSSGG